MDCMEYLKSVPDDIFDLTITSPPYNLGDKHHTGNNVFKAYNEFVDDIKEDEYQRQQMNVLNEIFRVTKPGGSILYNHKNRIKKGTSISPYRWIFNTEWEIYEELVWFNRSQNFDKCRFYPMTERIYWMTKRNAEGYISPEFTNNVNAHDLIKDEAMGTKNEHKRAFPLKLVDRFLLCFPNAMEIFDPYLGSGTTRIAAYKNGRNFVGCEISKSAFGAQEKRFKNHISQQVMAL